MIAAATSGPAGRGSQRIATSSSEALPQIPQEAEATKARAGTAAGSKARPILTTSSFSGVATSAGSASSTETEARSAGASRPSLKRNPTASSAS